jgi:hypothetical protein
VRRQLLPAILILGGLTLTGLAVAIEHRVSLFDLRLFGSTLITVGVAILIVRMTVHQITGALTARTEREDAAFRAGTEMGRKLGADEMKSRIKKMRVLTGDDIVEFRSDASKSAG